MPVYANSLADTYACGYRKTFLQKDDYAGRLNLDLLKYIVHHKYHIVPVFLKGDGLFLQNGIFAPLARLSIQVFQSCPDGSKENQEEEKLSSPLCAVCAVREKQRFKQRLGILSMRA